MEHNGASARAARGRFLAHGVSRGCPFPLMCLFAARAESRQPLLNGRTHTARSDVEGNELYLASTANEREHLRCVSIFELRVVNRTDFNGCSVGEHLHITVCHMLRFAPLFLRLAHTRDHSLA